MERTYINISFSQKDGAKRLGARFDGGITKWYFLGTDAHGYARFEYSGYIERRNECQGSCFSSSQYGCGACDRPVLSTSSGMGMSRPVGPGDTPCSICRIAAANPGHTGNDRCLECDIFLSTGNARTPGQERHNRQNGGRRLCLRCGQPLVPIGSARANGSRRHDEFEQRDYHVQCIREEFRK